MAARRWTPEQRAAQSAAILTWQPWQHSSGAKSAMGKAIVSRNAYRGGMRPFLRLINWATRAFKHPETLTIEIANIAVLRMEELCDSKRDIHNRRKPKSSIHSFCTNNDTLGRS
jgi:hypothetical protein